MTTVIKREKLLNGLEYASPGLSARGLVDQMNCFGFKNGYIWSYNDEVATRTKCPVPDLEGAIRADKLKEILHKVQDEKMEVKATKKKLIFLCRRKRFSVNMENEISLPIEELDYPKKDQWKSLPADFSDAIKLVQGCASRDDAAKGSLNCIHIHPKFIEAFDNYQLARYDMKMDLKGEILVKQVALRHIAMMTMIEFYETDNWVHFRDARKQIFSCRVYLNTYRDLGPIIEASGGKKLSLPKGLMEDSDEAGTFATDSQNPQENFVQVTIENNKFEIDSEGQHGEYHSWKKVKYKGKKIQFRILPKILAELIREHPKCRVNKKFLSVKSGRLTFSSALTKPKKGKKE